MRHARRPSAWIVWIAGLAGSAALCVWLAAPASAHVTASAPGATQGGYTRVSFNVPTESDTASTVGLKVQMPTDTPLASVSIQPKASWSYTVVKGKPSVALSSDDGPVTEVVTEVDWKAAAGGGIKPGEFDIFTISAGPMPKTSTVTFKAIQQYSDGTSVSWIEVPAAGTSSAPEHPAPTVSLAASDAAGDARPPASSSSPAIAANESAGSNGLAWAGLIVGALGLLAALVAIGWVRTVGARMDKGSSRP